MCVRTGTRYYLSQARPTSDYQNPNGLVLKKKPKKTTRIKDTAHKKNQKEKKTPLDLMDLGSRSSNLLQLIVVFFMQWSCRLVAKSCVASQLCVTESLYERLNTLIRASYLSHSVSLCVSRRSTGNRKSSQTGRKERVCVCFFFLRKHPLEDVILI